MALYKMVIKKKFIFDVSHPFVSTYELDSGVNPINTGVAKALMVDVAQAEAALLSASVEFVSGTISTWEPDSDPYDPDNLIPKALTGTGLRASDPDDLFDIDYVLKMIREPNSGKPGVINMRGALLDTDVETVSGEFRLLAGSPLAEGNSAFTAYVSGITAAFAAALVEHVMIGTPLVSITYPATPEGVKQVPIKNYGPPIVRGVSAINNPYVGPLQASHG